MFRYLCVEVLGTSIVSTGTVTVIGPGDETPLGCSDNLLVRTALLQIAQVTLHFSSAVLAKSSNAEA